MKAVSLLAVLQVLTESGSAALTSGRWEYVNPEDHVDKLESAKSARCGLGKEYRFGVFKPVAPSKDLVIEFMGGGLCFDKNSCYDTSAQKACVATALNPQLFTPGPTSFVDLFFKGIEDHSKDANPFKDYNHVFLPYCTCDFHWGNQFVDFSKPGNIFVPGSNYSAVLAEDATPGESFAFNGYKNFQFVMDWIKANLKEEFGMDKPRKVVVTGCSAGGFGMSLLQDQVFRAFPESQRYSITDSAFGKLNYLPFNMFTNNSSPDLPYSASVGKALEVDFPFPKATRDIVDAQNVIASEFPEVKMATFAFLDDPTINDRPGLLAQVSANQNASFCNVVNLVANGAKHCIILNTGFYSQELSDGQKLVTAVNSLVNDVCVESALPSEANIEDFNFCEKGSSCIAATNPPSAATNPPSAPSTGLPPATIGAIAGASTLVVLVGLVALSRSRNSASTSTQQENSKGAQLASLP